MSVQNRASSEADIRPRNDRLSPRPVTSRVAWWSYRVATVLLLALMTLSGVANLVRPAPVAQALRHLGYPEYFPLILGTAKLLGVLALLLPGTRRLKEWAYAGFTFDLLAAVTSHLAVGDAFGEQIPVLVGLIFLVISYAGQHARTAMLDLGTAGGVA